MQLLEKRITFKVLIGYIILGLLAATSGYLVLSEVKTFTQLQKQDISDRNIIVKTGTLIANIYKNESLARAALQLNSKTKFEEYLNENKQLVSKIDSLSLIVANDSQEFILDSIKLIIDKKLRNIIDLKNLNRNYDSDQSINKAINKLSAIDSLLGKGTTNDLVENPFFLYNETQSKFENFTSALRKYIPNDSTNNIEQKQIDSLVSISRSMLKEAQNKTNKHRIYLKRKQNELIENDLTISRKLQELLENLEKDIILYTSNMNKHREATLNHSRNIILFAAGISFIIIIIFSIIILGDFWKSQRYRKQLEKANATTKSILESREQLISMVSHDLRTPLSTISGFSELLQKSTQNTKDKNYIDHIRSASNYMGKLVDDLLEFSKLENGHVAIESVPFNLENYIDEITQNAKTIIQEKPIRFVIKQDSAINNQIISDPFRIKQILSNLIVNACKFTNKGTITIKSFLKQQGSKSSLEILVSDTGIGISENKKATIFKAFNQADNDNENNLKGFGLGLTISKQLAELLGGTLTLESKLNIGSTFTLKIPVKLSEKPLIKINEPKDEITRFNLTAVIIEDDASIQQLLKVFLNQFNIKTYTFDNAQKAIEAIDKIAYDFVLTDIQLPKMNGIHFMEILKNSEFYQNQPIIAMTGRANISTKEYLKIGFSEVLIKPFDSNKLQNILQQFFNARLLETKAHTINNDKITAGFSIETFSSFLNNDITAIRSTLQLFLEETQKDYLLLKKAKQNNDLHLLNEVSHKMLSMFKQLEVKAIIPYLEVFETTNFMDNKVFMDFEGHLKTFIKALKNYLN
ncbi:hybrid sensor histidine kinase/response regulator [Polaribacter sp. ALD11]|uniref:hybrid sensor histidine kinase/response regulator n=1 Tax=Polaribacter sp. ALD11 TaxID=2058137 RepID=UPI000C313E57|nr:ATP-binding protein [Polaribacter sp. ALD11]AUC86098.1 hybrid sensor histidine kinase/response regulator [Polaribacter sp. ALD11]